MTLDREALIAALEEHPVSFALLFGSAASDGDTPPRDVDVAVEFEAHRPSDTGYFDRYFAPLRDLETAVDSQVDLVDVRSMSPGFARVALDNGEILVGTEEQRAELDCEFAGSLPSVSESRERVAAAAARLREEPVDGA